MFTIKERLDPADTTVVDKHWLAQNLKYYLQLTIPLHEGEYADDASLESIFSQYEKTNLGQTGGILPAILAPDETATILKYYNVEITNEKDVEEVVGILLDELDKNTGSFFATDTQRLRTAVKKYKALLAENNCETLAEYILGLEEEYQDKELSQEEASAVYTKITDLFTNAGFTVGDFNLMFLSGAAGLTSVEVAKENAEQYPDDPSYELWQRAVEKGYFQTTFKLKNGESITLDLALEDCPFELIWMIFEKDYSPVEYERQPMIALIREALEEGEVSEDELTYIVKNISHVKGDSEEPSPEPEPEPKPEPEQTEEPTEEIVPEQEEKPVETVETNKAEVKATTQLAKSPKTGDNTQMMHLLVLFFLAGAALIVIHNRRRMHI